MESCWRGIGCEILVFPCLSLIVNSWEGREKKSFDCFSCQHAPFYFFPSRETETKSELLLGTAEHITFEKLNNFLMIAL